MPSHVIVQVDPATDEILLQIEGSKTVRLSDGDADRLARYLQQAREVSRGESAS